MKGILQKERGDNYMKYKVQVSDMKRNNSYLQGLANITFGDAIKITGVKLGLGKEDSLFVGMPNYKAKEKVDGKDVYNDIGFPVTKEFRDELYEKIFDTFDNLHDGNGGTLIFNADSEERVSPVVRVTPLENGQKGVKALATIVINEVFAFNNISLRENGKGELFVAYPSYKTNKIGMDGKPKYQEIFHPVTKQWRDKLDKMVKAEYQKALKQEKEVPEQTKAKDEKKKEEQQPKQGSKARIA